MLIQLTRLSNQRYSTLNTFCRTFPQLQSTLDRHTHSVSLSPSLVQAKSHSSLVASSVLPRTALDTTTSHYRSAGLTLPLIHRRGTKLQALLGEAGLTEMDSYTFPDYRLKRKMDDPNKTPLLLVACGSFSPITFLHLRMFVMAGDYMKHNTNFELIGGYLSPVSDAYKKQGLAAAEHR